MATTLKDIAAAAGVSVGTVDRALHDRGRIDPEVARRVKLIARQLNYHANTAAQKLAAIRKPLRINVIMHAQENEYYSQILDGVKRAAIEIADYGCDLSVSFCTNFDPIDQLHLIRTAVKSGVDGIILVPIDVPSIREEIYELTHRGLPVVFLSSVLEGAECLSSVHSDFRQSGALAAGLAAMITAGRGKILYFSPSMAMEGHRIRTDALKSSIEANFPDMRLLSVTELTNDSFDNFTSVSKALTDHPDADTVIYSGHTPAALKAISGCSHPIHCIFFDLSDAAADALSHRRIDAAILQDPQTQGYTAVMTLFQKLAYDVVPDREILVHNEIIIPESLSTESAHVASDDWI